MRDVCIAFGGPLLLNKIQLQIVQGERVCLTGRNGMGKTTLMKLIAGDILPDSGEIVRQQGIRIGFLAQDVPREINGRVFETALNLGDRNTESHEEKQQQTSEILSRMKLDPQAEFQGLSAGMKRRVLLAGALACKPDILLLDEPTNHLDIDATVWMEEFLLRHVRTLLFVTHDRMFLQRIANRIIELDRGTLTRWDCDYKTYLERRQAGIEIEAKQNSLSDKKLASEESWIRQGVKARRTRNEGRVKALEKMRELRQARKERVGTVRMQAQEAERSGKLVIEAQDLSYDYEGPPIISDFSATVMRGDKVGIIG
ncbi:MAG: ABC transporter ATP-binding protein, partial [Desulfobacteraceae bacterium IS3]